MSVAPPVYKIVELSIVTDESLEETINHWVARGWTWDGVRFVVTEASRRPQMAFVSFVRTPGDPPRDPPAPGA